MTDWRNAPAGTLLQIRELPEAPPLASPLIVFRFDNTMGGNGIAQSVMVLEGSSAGLIRSAGNQFWPAMDVSELVELCIRNAGPIRVMETEPSVGQLVMLPHGNDKPYAACFMAAGYNKELTGYVCLHSRVKEYTPGSLLAQLDHSKLLRVGSVEIRELRN